MGEHPTVTAETAGTPGILRTVTILLAEIPDSTALWERDPAAMRSAASRFDALLREAAEANDGYASTTIGDTFQSTFSSATRALQAAIDAQLLFFTEQWPSSLSDLEVRMALHSGLAEEEGTGGYRGPIHNKVAALLAAGHGGQVLLSAASQELVRDYLSQLQPADPPGIQLRDLDKHRLKDLARPEHIFQLVVPGLPAHFPPIHSLDSLPNNLPRQSTPLIGREKQTREVVALLRHPNTNILTLTGPAGTGKTRLSLQVAAQALQEHRDGVWFVELAALSPDEHKLVASSIAEALAVREAPGQAVIETLKEYLSDKEMLLVLDNFEQLTPAAPQVASLLKAAPHLKVLVTSRTPLHVYGEREYHVPPLSVPDHAHPHASDKHLTAEEQAAQVAQFTRYEAVRLFVERAQAVKNDFQITAENAATIAEICSRLDGLPLAIELAAARTRLFTPQALLGRLTSRLKLLTGGARDRTARQQTLRGAIDWSYDLLSEGEKQLLQRMAVFNGGRTLEAIETVCNSEALQVEGELQVDVLDGVQSLLDKSLLVQREGSNGEPRYQMLETIHEYAREKLEESGECEALRREHALYFMQLAEEAETHLTGPRQQEWLERLEDEHDNLRTAMRRAAEVKGDEDASIEAVESGLRIGGAIWRFWQTRGYFSEGRDELERVLAAADRTRMEGLDQSRYDSIRQAMAKALNGAGVLAWRQGDYHVARNLNERSLQMYKEIGDRWGTATALNDLGGVSFAEGNYQAARTVWEESLAIRREIGDKWGVARSLNNLGSVARVVGDNQSARTLHEQCLGTLREIGDKWGTANSLNNLGIVIQTAGDFKAARSLYEESLAIRREIGDKRGIAMSLSNLGNVAYGEGDYEEARSLYEQGLAIKIEIGGKEGIAISLSSLGGVAAKLGQPERGARLLGASESLLEAIGAELEPDDRVPYDEGIALARANLGDKEFERLKTEGQRMDMEGAVDFALQGTQAGHRPPSELRVDINQEKKARQVEAITGTEYFRELQARAQSLRLGSKP